MNTATPTKRNGVNYNLTIISKPVIKAMNGKPGRYASARATTTLRGKVTEITVAAYENANKEGVISAKSIKAVEDLGAKNIGDITRTFGQVKSFTTPEGKKSAYFKVLAVDTALPVRKKADPAPEVA